MSESGAVHEIETDVVVVGSGGAGLVAALSARVAGAEVVLLERTEHVGGTTAVSGGVVWVPCNDAARAAGIADSRDDALTYLRLITQGRTPDAALERYVDAAPETLRLLERETTLRFACLTTYPDYHAEFAGGRAGGRSLDNGLFDTNLLGEWRARLRKNPITGRAPLTIDEAMRWGAFWNPLGLPHRDISERAKAGVVHGGAALVGKLLLALLARGVEPRLGARVRELIVEGDRVLGVVAGQGDATWRVRARGGVVLASGGFEWDPELRKAFLPIELTHPVSVPSSDGDGLRLAQSVGARLGNMNEAWWTPAVAVPGETYDGAPLHRSEFSVRCLPHSIIVNAAGRRFTSEAHNYNDMTKPMLDQDPVRHRPRNVPAWLVVDRQFLEKYVLVTAVAARPLPDYVRTADDLDSLAALIGVDAVGLARTVESFNAAARAGVDLEHGRGETAFERFYGDPRQTPNPNLGTLERGPFYALPLHVGAMGTKGGPVTGPSGQVQRVDGSFVAGLYAAGNVAASAMGPGYPGAGATIGLAITLGRLAGEHAAARAKLSG